MFGNVHVNYRHYIHYCMDLCGDRATTYCIHINANKNITATRITIHWQKYSTINLSCVFSTIPTCDIVFVFSFGNTPHHVVSKIYIYSILYIRYKELNIFPYGFARVIRHVGNIYTYIHITIFMFTVPTPLQLAQWGVLYFVVASERIYRKCNVTQMNRMCIYGAQKKL